MKFFKHIRLAALAVLTSGVQGCGDWSYSSNLPGPNASPRPQRAPSIG